MSSNDGKEVICLERKTVNVMSDVKDDLTNLKNKLGLSNESDTIKFLIELHKTSKNIPSQAVLMLVDLKK